MWSRNAVALALLGLAAGCTEAALRRIPEPPPTPVDDKLAIQGKVCTDDPTSLTFPVKVLFIIDSSGSMAVSDPPDPVTGKTGRHQAVEDIINLLLDRDPEGVGIGLISFEGPATILTQCDERDAAGNPVPPGVPDGVPDTDCFSNNRAELILATTLLDVGGGLTAYFSALGEAFSMLSNDVQNVDEISLARSKYVFVFMSDGIPETDLGEERSNILGAVRDMVELADTKGVGEFTFSTAYLSVAQPPDVARAAEDLLQAMADEGQGTYRSFPNGEAINFLDIDLTSLRRAFTLSTVVVNNSNVLIQDSEIVVDSDSDTLADDAEDLDGDLHIDVDEDLNGDGILGEDVDEDGRLDVDEDDNGNGVLDLGDDPDCNGVLDDGDDLDGDGNLDPTEDQDCDGVLDVDEDTNGDGALDTSEDQDGDGHLDVAESDPMLRDTDGYGFNDGLEVSLCPDFRDPARTCRFTPIDPANLPPPPAEPQPEDCTLDIDKADVDGDGLRDCEERFYGTTRLSYDSDRDGLPDQVEIRYGTNPADPDAEDDTDFDTTTNGQEVRTFGDPRNNDAAVRAERGYRYQVISDELVGARGCREFRVENITLVDTRDDGWNLIYVYAGQVPFDDPNAVVDYRVACAWARFDADLNAKDPPGGFIELQEEDFHPPACGATSADDCVPLVVPTDCVGPRSL